MATPGPNVDPTSCTTPEDCFGLFFDDNLLDYLTAQTNLYAQKKISAMQVTDHSLYKKWKPVSTDEMRGLIAVVLNMGVIQLGNLKDYWSTDETMDLPFFRSVFTRDRFFQIFGALYVGDPDSQVKMDKVQPLLDRLGSSFASVFTPHQQIAVDESVIAFKGRVSFKQYLKGKPTPWGIKAFVLSDSTTGYLHQLRVYYGKDTNLIDRPELKQTVRVVCTLAEPFKDQGYDLYIDRFYSSPELAEELGKMGISVTGTVQTNRRGIPKAWKKKKKRPRGSVQAIRSDDGNGKLLLLTWMDKRQIMMLSTKHTTTMQDVVSR